MKQLTLLLFSFCCLTATAVAQKVQPLPAALQALEPQNIFPSGAEKDFVFSDKNKTAAGSFSAAFQNENNLVFTAENSAASSSHFNVQTTWKSSGPVKRGDVLLARFAIRSIYAKQESGDAIVYFFINQGIAPFERNIIVDISAGPEWKWIDVPFKADHNMAAGEGTIGFTFGALAQKVEIAAVQVLNFEKKTDVTKLPITRLTYQGREPGAAWRNEALKRIEELRTAPLVIQVKDVKGKPVNGANVTARLIDPRFLFGTAVSANLITGNDSNAMKYKSLVAELFNAVTIDNNLKWGSWRDPQKQQITKNAIAWILENNLHLRGHNLVWPGKKFTPAFFASQPGFGPSFSDSITAHIEDIATYTKGKVYGWDVINEMVHQKDYFTVMPRSQAVQWFKQAKRIDPGATLFINEYSMLNNIRSPDNIREYIELIKELRNGGAPIEAIGVQGHVGRQPRNPVQVLTDLDLFTATGLPVQITEFDINSPDEELQADYTRDFLIACYSHPVVNGFTMWGFWEGAHWKPDAAMYKKDWTAKLNAAVWRDLVTKQWRTNITATSDSRGEVTSRGHLGKYEITVTKGGKTVKKIYRLAKEASMAIIEL